MEEVDEMTFEQAKEIEKLNQETNSNKIIIKQLKEENYFLLKEIDNEKIDRIQMSETHSLEKDILTKFNEDLKNDKENDKKLYEIKLSELADENESLLMKNKDEAIKQNQCINLINSLEEKNKNLVQKIIEFEANLKINQERLDELNEANKQNVLEKKSLSEKNDIIHDLEEKNQHLTYKIIELEKSLTINQKKFEKYSDTNEKTCLEKNSLKEKNIVLERKKFEIEKIILEQNKEKTKTELILKSDIKMMKIELESKNKDYSNYLQNIHEIEKKYSKSLEEKEYLINNLTIEKKKNEVIINNLFLTQRELEEKMKESVSFQMTENNKNENLCDIITDILNLFLKTFDDSSQTNKENNEKDNFINYESLLKILNNHQPKEKFFEIEKSLSKIFNYVKSLHKKYIQTNMELKKKEKKLSDFELNSLTKKKQQEQFFFNLLVSINDEMIKSFKIFSDKLYGNLNKLRDFDKKIEIFQNLFLITTNKSRKNQEKINFTRSENIILQKNNEELIQINQNLKTEFIEFAQENKELKQNKELFDKILQNSARNFLDLEKKRDILNQISETLKEKLKTFEDEIKKKDEIIETLKKKIGFLQENNVILHKDIKEKMSEKRMINYFLIY